MGSGERGRAGAVVAVGGVVLLFFVFLLWYGGWAPVLVFLFYPFLESSCLGAPGLAFCQAGGSRLWCVAWCGGCVPSLSGFIGSIVDFTFFVYRDNSCCSLFWLSRRGFSVFWWWCCFFLCGWEFIGERVWCVLFGAW